MAARESKLVEEMNRLGSLVGELQRELAAAKGREEAKQMVIQQLEARIRELERL